MIVEIINTGTELLLGQIVNTNAPFLAQRLNDLGFDVLFHTTVGDNRERMHQALVSALARADIVVMSGGLGPTQGDITKEIVAQVLDRKMILHEPSVRHIECYFAKRHRHMPESNIRQALIPESAIVLENERGTAPGIISEFNDKIIINLPGPPHELEWMFEKSVIPYLKNKFEDQGTTISRVLRTYGLGESALEEKINDLIAAQNNPTIALLARKGEIFVRITAKGATKTIAEQLISDLESKTRQRIEEYIFAVDDKTLEGVVGELLTAKRLTLALAESCTGGLITSRITDIPGSSDYLLGSIVCYSNQIKTNIVNVPETILAENGAVSEETAIHMASGIKNKFTADIGIGITGIAGPGGATATKPVGLAFIALDGPWGIQCHQHYFTGQRSVIKEFAAQAALNHLRRYLLQI